MSKWEDGDTVEFIMLRVRHHAKTNAPRSLIGLILHHTAGCGRLLALSLSVYVRLVQRQNLEMALEMGVTLPHLRTSYNLFFLNTGVLGVGKRMVVSLSSLYVVMKIAFA